MAPSKTSRRERSTGPWALSASPITAPIFVAAFLIAGAQPAHAAGMVGDGTPASCTEAALDAALAGGGLVTFNCGAAPVTIILTAEKTITEEMGETIVDGASLVTLSGGGTTRIFNVTAGGMLEVQKLIIANGSVAGNDQGGSIVNSTFSGNQADLGAGAIDAPCQTSVTNSIIANSSGANCGNGLDGSPAITDGGHNIQFPDRSCGETIPSLDPLLDPAGLKDNGGPTQTIALLPNSPAVNAGDEAVCGAAPVNGLDQRGYQRPGGGYTNCSIGAFEYSGPGPTPTPTATSTPPATATLTPSQPPVSTPTATGKAGGGGGGCTVTPSHSGGAAWWLLAPALVLARARRGRARAVPK